MAVRVIDLNADLGEGSGIDLDRQLLEVVSSANVATGGHAGTFGSMVAVCEAALELGVSVGAHPSYDDREGFGRVEPGLPPEMIRELTLRQLERFASAAAQVGLQPSHVKPHGALYHRLAGDAEAAEVFAIAVAEVLPAAELVGGPGSQLAGAAGRAGLGWLAEGFADRAYLPTGGLVPRSEPGALLTPDEAADQALRLVGLASTEEGIPAGQVATICIHGDGEHAVAVATAVAAALTEAGVAVGRGRGGGGAP